VGIETSFLQNVVKLFGLRLGRAGTVQETENNQIKNSNLDTHKVIIGILECIRLKHLVELGIGISECGPGVTVELLSQCLKAAKSLIASLLLCT
jgi:hypothetical protein